MGDPVHVVIVLVAAAANKMTTHCGLPFPSKWKLHGSEGLNTTIEDKLHLHSRINAAAAAPTKPPTPIVVATHNGFDHYMGCYSDINCGKIKQGTILSAHIGIEQHYLHRDGITLRRLYLQV
jgi:hypothetical protein